jgi:hypothetical protein
MSEIAHALFANHGETTSQRVARLAAIGAKHPERLTLDEIRAVCGSALTQAPDHQPRNALAEIGRFPGDDLNPVLKYLFDTK